MVTDSHNATTTLPELPRSSELLGLLKSLPPDGILQALDIVHTVVKTQAEVVRDNAEFMNRLELLRTGNADTRERLEFLRELLLEGNLPETAQLRLVDAICQLALK